MPTIRKRGKTYRAEVRIKGAEVSQTFATKSEAQVWAADTERSIRAGRGAFVNRTVRDALERYQREVTPKKPSKKWETNRINWLCREPFADLRLAEARTPVFAAWRDKRAKLVSGSTVIRDFSVLSHVFAVARDEWQWIDYNPCSKVSRPKGNPARKRRVSPDELAALYAAAGNAAVSKRVVMAFEFCIETACRGGEALRIRATDRTETTVHLPETKNGEARTVPLSHRAREILDTLPDGFALSDQQKDAMFRKLRTKAAMPDLNFHDSRHEAITRLAKLFDVLDLARITGHRDINELLTYYHADAAALAVRFTPPRPLLPEQRSIP